MSRIIKKSSAGTMESSDMYVEISPADDIKIELDSIVSAQFGDEIRSLISEVLTEQGISGAYVKAIDRGALDCVIRSRVETAIKRAKEA